MRFPALIEPLADKLRGPHRSIRYRFWKLPIEKVRLRWYYLRGKSWIDFYSDRMDSMTDKTMARRPPQEYLDRGRAFLDYLQRYGLTPKHRVLDYGCGVLRGALYLVPYLERGNYVGVDIAQSRLDKGHRLMQEAGISRHEYTTHLVRNCELRELGDQEFDYVWANSVLTHMPEGDIRVLARALKKHLAPGACFFFTYSPSERLGLNRPVQEKIKNYYYPTDYLRKIFEEQGYEFTVTPDGHAMDVQSPTVRVRLPPG